MVLTPPPLPSVELGQSLDHFEQGRAKSIERFSCNFGISNRLASKKVILVVMTHG
jgi:hypothetical protein